MKYCIYCNSNNTFQINSLKHYWTYCLNCKNQKSFPKKKKTIFNKFEYFFLILDKFFKTTLQNMLCYYKTSPSDQYYYYKDVIKNHKYEDTKWFSYDSEFINFLKNNLIDLQDKKVISISEEPGFFYKLIKDKCRKVLFTALNNSVTEIMIQQIGVDTITYDANKDDISKLVNDSFDIILIRAVLGHIDDLEKFINQIKKIAHKDSVIILSFHTPSKQTPIIFGYDDYTINCLWDSQFVQNLFKKENFEITKIFSKTEDLIEKYYWNKRKGLLFIPLYYIFKNFINPSLNRENFLETYDTNVTLILKNIS
jgi:SAM-dependent methyltransferase